MSVITIPAAVHDTLGGQSFGQHRYDVAESSDVTGDSAVNAGAPPRWTSGLRSADGLTLEEAGEWEGLLLRLRGGINYLAVYDKLRPAPLGTMRGEPKIGAAVAVGDSTAVLVNFVGTLKAGDWLQFSTGVGSSQLVKVVQACASSVLTPTAAAWSTTTPAAASWTTSGAAAATWFLGGSAVVTFQPEARYSYAVGTAVAWDKPVAYMAMTTNRLVWQAGRNGPLIDGFSVDLQEQWA